MGVLDIVFKYVIQHSLKKDNHAELGKKGIAQTRHKIQKPCIVMKVVYFLYIKMNRVLPVCRYWTAKTFSTII